MTTNLNQDVFNAIHNTIVLLGGDSEIISIIKKYNIEFPQEETVTQLINWNLKQTDKVKAKIDRLTENLKSCGGIKVLVKH
jgi:hypothetical protein